MDTETQRSHFWTGYEIGLSGREPFTNGEWIWTGYKWGKRELQRQKSLNATAPREGTRRRRVKVIFRSNRLWM
jgi:hypothetical protein